MKYIFTILLFLSCLLMKSQYAASNFTLISNINPETGFNAFGAKYSGCWGWYQAAKNKEYAIACSKSGTYWIDVTNPATPTVSAFRLGTYTNTVWREAKTYQNFCYVIGDAYTPNSFQIFDMQYLPDSVHKVYDSKALFELGHTLWVDGNKLYVSGITYSNTTESSLNVYSLATPTAPVLIRQLDQDYPFIQYVHDAFSRNDTVYASCGNQGLYVFKLTAANTFTQLGSLSSYAFAGYNHSSALTPNGQTLVFTDEVPGGLPVKVANVSNLSNIQISATTNQFSQTTPHNPFIVSNQYCFMSSYQEGLQLYDISIPMAPTLAGYFDTYPQGGGNVNNWGNDDYMGQWGCYPYLPSKTIFALDMQNGIFLLKTGLYQNPQVVTTFTPQSPLCSGLTMSLTNGSTGAINYTWTFSGGTPTISTVANPTVAFATAGIHTITLLASNPSYSATLTRTVDITANTLAPAITTTNSGCGTCSTGIAQVNLLGGTAPYTYTWLPTGGNSPLAQNLAPGCYTVNMKDAAMCAASTTTCIDFFTGLNLLSANPSLLAIYPNPAQQQVTVNYPGTFSCMLYDLTGKQVLIKKDIQASAVLNLEKISKGVYLLEVENAEGKTQKKLVLE